MQVGLRLPKAMLVLALCTPGCFGGETMTGRIEPIEGAATPITLEYDTELIGDDGTLSVTVPSGEIFEGRYLQISSEASGDTLGAGWGGWGPWAPYWGDWGPFGSPWVSGTDFPTFIQNHSGKVLATLYGDQGSVMRCRFQLIDPDESMEGGGIGECQTSKGEKIAAQF